MYESAQEPEQMGAGTRLTCLLTGILWPIACFALAAKEFPDEGPLWQSGAWSDICSLMLGGHPSYALYPILIYSIVSLGCLLWTATWARRQLWVRVGVYGGLILALILSWVFGVAVGHADMTEIAIFMLIGSAIPVTGLILDKYASGWQRRFPQTFRAIVTIASLLAAALLVMGVGVVFGLFLAPWFTVMAFALATLHLVKTTSSRRFGIASLLASISWLSALAASCKVCYERAMQIYSTLPTTYVSDCFIVTAAAQGHPWLVGSWRTPSGRNINRQLLRCKAFELSLQEKCPGMHRILRKFYNRIGPRIARKIRNRWAADVVYLSLKPLEIVAVGFSHIEQPKATVQRFQSQ